MSNTSNYQRLNNIIGWLIFLIASFVYLSTIESTGSFWDCGEYIASAYKLEVGHPPGAPVFLLIGRLFSLLAFGDTTKVGMMVNAVSAMSSAFTILFLFWTITALGRKMVEKELTTGSMYAVLGAGAVGALAYTFSDSFWFSASEGEVYAMSSFFTAIVFWAILKWERETDNNLHADRWIILIAYLVGLSIGVHLLNLLAIPAIVFIYYFKKHEPTRNGLIITGILSIVILGGIQAGVIPMVVKLAAKFELLAVNTLGLPFNSGILIYGVLLIGGIIYGLRYTEKKIKPILNTVILSFTVILIGYSSFLILVIRSNANPPMDENNPEDAINLLSYLNREQYGTWPILYGPYFTAPLDAQKPYTDGEPVYMQDEKSGKYVISDSRKGSVPNYDKRFCTVFPRMWSSQQNHVIGYKVWTDERHYEKINIVNPQTGEPETIEKPTFAQDLGFFFNYQIGHMYMRYFFWNFVGRQNDVQGHGNITDGNWITGIDFIDEARLGPQHGLPDDADHNKAKNVFYGLPFLLGLIGLFYHIKKDNKNAFVVALLFLFTGLAIVVYLNQKPYEPRERDYAYAASFYAYAIWIGLGVMGIYEFLKGKLSDNINALATTAVCLLAVPTIMAKENWDDHDRSGRYIARDFAADYLNSCAPNAILFTNGDNDTFPLWYAQEVEGIRTDVRVVCLELLNTDWYVDQMVRRAYKSAPVPITFTKNQYRQGTRDIVLFQDYNGMKVKGYIPVKDLIEFVKSDAADHRVQVSNDTYYNFFPTKNMSVPVDSAAVVNNGTVPKELANRIVKSIDWTLSGSYVQKNDLMILDMLAHNNWERPIYFAATAPASSYLNLAPYLQLEGFAYRLVPIKKSETETQETRVATDIMYDKVMKFAWGGMEKPGMNLDNVFIRSCAVNTRQRLGELAVALLEEGKKDKAIKVLDKAVEVTPQENIPYDATMYSIVMGYYQAEAYKKANDLAEKLYDNCENNINYYYSIDKSDRDYFNGEIKQAQDIAERLIYFTRENFKQTAFSKKIEARYSALLQKYGLTPKVQQ
jgi:tetratricopeptide (TPR) repeat protein